jgi:choline monooxygenase
VTSVLDLREASERPAYRLPPDAYFDPAWYEREQRELFGRTWNLVGHVSEVPNAGDFVTAMVGADPVVVVRAPDGGLQGYLNVCRHRGMVIECAPSGNCGNSLRCMYHGWEWNLAGALERIPQRKTQFPDVDANELGLLPVSVGVFNGFVFVHPDPAPQTSFAAWLGDYPLQCGDYPWDEMVEIGRARVPLACNWKLYIENHIDWLHLWYLHQDSLKQYEHHEARYATTGLHWYSAETLRPDESPYDPAGLRPIPGLPPQELRILRANLMFPNVPFAMMGSMVQSYQVVPTGPETCELDIRGYGAPGSVITDETRNQGLIVLRDEDGTACERMQIAMHSSRFAVGPLAIEHEKPIADFQRNLLSFLDT